MAFYSSKYPCLSGKNCTALKQKCTYSPFCFWLWIRFVSLYPILFHAFKVPSWIATLYLNDLIHVYMPVRMLAIWVLFTFEGARQNSHVAMCGEIFYDHQLADCGKKCPDYIKLAASQQIFYRVLKTHLCKLPCLSITVHWCFNCLFTVNCRTVK